MTAITSNFTNSGEAASYSASATLTLAVDAYLISTTGDALDLSGSGQTYDVTINGLMQGKTSDIYAGIYLEGSNNTATITVNAGGVVRGDAGLYLAGTADVVNHGGIFANTNVGIYHLVDGDSSLTNTGTISSTTNAAVYFHAAGTHSIVNSGLIEGSSFAIGSDVASSVELVTNSGTINGNLNLIGGDDIVHNESGIINGTVFLGNGADQFYGGLTAVTVNGGDGVDLIIGGDGDDVIDGGDGVANLSSPQYLDGGAGNDQITGGAGYDALSGGTGTNTLIGGAFGDDYTINSQTDVIVEVAGGGDDDAVFTSVSYTLGAGVSIEYLQASNGAGTDPINLTGNDLAQVIFGNAGNNILDGGGDDGVSDQLSGGGGNDTYILGGETLDVVDDSSGVDTITSTISRNLADFTGIENLTLLGTNDIAGTGDGAANIITGNSGANTLDGGADTVADTLIGGAGDDTYIIRSTKDVVVESTTGADTIKVDGLLSYTMAAGVRVEILETLDDAGTSNINLTGNERAEGINGNAGNNVLDGGGDDGEADFLSGLGGNDTYVLGGETLDVVEDSGGIDTITSTISRNLGGYADIEKLVLLGTAGSGTGNALANTITGNASKNILDGGVDTLADTLIGGAGSDTYIVRSANDVIVETADAGEADKVQAAVSYTLGSSARVERMETIDAAATTGIKLTGNGFSQTITGNAGANTLDGGGGVDTLVGGNGNDTYLVDTLTDKISEGSGEGAGAADIVKFTGTANQTFTLATNIEKLQLLGTAATNGTGNSGGNTLTGNSADNILNGAGGNDTLTGGLGHDIFVFDTTLKSTNVDTIVDFKSADDTINIDNAVFLGLSTGTLSKNDLKQISSATSTAGVDSSDRILYDKAHGDLYFDRDGSGSKYDRVLFAHVTDGTAISNADFHIV